MNLMTKIFLNLLNRPSRSAYVQTAALCLQPGQAGLDVMLVQTLRLRQWVIPKGWPIPGLSLPEAAAQEAWEEAGVRGTVWPQPVGSFTYSKVKKSGLPVQCCAQVFRLDVEQTADDYPEAAKRLRTWVPVAQAATMVRDPELAAILRGL